MKRWIEKVFYEKKLKLTILQKQIVARLYKQQRNNDLPEIQYKIAVSALHDASKKFDKYSNRQCEFSVGASGAVASGAG